MDFKDYYKILGVTYDASQLNIERAYARELPTYMSPVNRTSELNEAYSVLSNTTRRAEYDKELRKRISERDIAIGNATNEAEAKEALSAYPSADPVGPIEPAVDPEKIDPSKPEEPAVDPEKIDPSKPEEPAVDPEKVDPSKPEEPSVDPEKVDPAKSEEPSVDPEKIDPAKLGEPAVEPKKETMSNKKYKVVKTAAIAGTALATGFFVLAVGGTAIAVAAGAVLGGFITSKIANKIRKYSLKKDKKVKKISEIKTQEAMLIEENNKKIEEQIDKLLSEPHNSYKLEASKIRYANEIELLKARIELKKSQKVKKGQLTKYKLELAALNMQLERANKNLKDIEQKISDYNKDGNGLKRINDELVDVQGKLDRMDPKDNKKTVSIKKLEITKSALEKKRDKRARRFKLVRRPVNAMKNAWFKGVDYLKGAVDVARGNYSPEEETEKVRTR